MKKPTYSCERDVMKRGYTCVAGVDEVGTGALAGPVVAGAVVLVPGTRLGIVNDSKLLSPQVREEAADLIRLRALAWSIGKANVLEISQLNIRQAAFLAMRRAIEALSLTPDYVLSDGFRIPNLTIDSSHIVRGDRMVKSIAAASIIAKVHRDKLMCELHEKYPLYGFQEHKGYATIKHKAMIRAYGASQVHRKEFIHI